MERSYSKHCRCDEGQLFYFKMGQNAGIYSKIMVDGAKCEWMKICTNGQQGVKRKRYHCYDTDLINVYVRNGFVVMPGAPNGFPIRLVKSTKDVNSPKKLSSRPTQIGFDYDGERVS
ncbi:hypothetical protein COOONC_26313 [Cooperia oncophora]